MPKRKFNALARHLQDIMMESLPKMSQVDVAKMIADAIQQEHKNFRSEISSQGINLKDFTWPLLLADLLPFALEIRMILMMMLILRGENNVKRQKTSEHETIVFGESSSGQDYESDPGPSTSGNQDQSDNFDFWTNSYTTNDDVLPNEKVSQELMDEMSQTVDEAKLHKVVDEMIRQQCTSGDEHQKEIIVPPYQPKPTPIVQSFQRDPKAHALSLVNQDLLYLKKGNTRPEKIALSLHKFLAVRFPYNDIEERTFRWELGHEHKFITEIVARRVNGCIVSITESDYKNLNKNDIEDMYLLIINHKVDDYAKTGLLWSLPVFIRSIEKYKMFSIVYESVYDIIYKNNKKEKRVMRHQEVHKFCDATLKRVLEGLKRYNNNVKYGYVTHNLSKEDVEYLQLFAENIEERLKYRDQIRRWEMYVNGRPLGSRRERPE
ncbi:hypothetical protein Tco_1420705 [Tanacetum coccineum]